MQFQERKKLDRQAARQANAQADLLRYSNEVVASPGKVDCGLKQQLKIALNCLIENGIDWYIQR